MRTISVQEYIILMNQKIEVTDGYKPGMKVYLVPTEDCYTGWDCDPKDQDTIQVARIADNELKKEYVVKV